MYDLIGDIHGHADELERLLAVLGYRESSGTYRHPQRRTIFLGDFIDRGPKIRRVLEIVRPMIEEGHALAVMGNHELNALAYHTEDPDSPGEHLRPRTPKNVRQHRRTIEQLSATELESHLNWFQTLPLWLDLDGLRAVHACWDERQMAVIDQAHERHNGITTEFLCSACRKGNRLFDYRLVALDQRGHGKSDKPHDDRQYGMEMVRDVVRVMDHLNIEKAHVVGYSMGGFVVGRLLADYPHRVSSAVIGGNGGFRSGDYAEFVKAFSGAVADGLQTGDALIEHYELAGFPPMNDSLKQEFLKLNNTSDATTLAAVARGWNNLALSADELRAIEIPTLVIHGEHENAFGIGSAKQFDELVPNSRLVVVPEQDHEHALTSEVFAVEVRKFVNEVARGATPGARE
jgi:pimeloyl-ACP methyl ester carboxylesterase